VLISEKITLVLAVWILVALIITSDKDLEIFFVLIFIGILIARQLMDVYTTTILKDRMNIFIYLFLIIFIIIVGKKIITILGV
jgi:hypothetical protein